MFIVCFKRQTPLKRLNIVNMTVLSTLYINAVSVRIPAGSLCVQ